MTCTSSEPFRLIPLSGNVCSNTICAIEFQQHRVVAVIVVRCCIAYCLVSLMLLSSPHTEAGNDPVGAAVERGVAWVIDHPATVDDGGFLDIVDESLFYLTLGRLAADQASRLRYGGFLEQSLARLISALEAELALNKPRDSLMDNYHIVLAAHLLGTVDKPFASRDRIIGEAQRVLQASQREAPTFRITVALLLQHLGAEPQVDIDALLETSLINQVAGAGNLSVFGRGAAYPAFRHPLFYYALVHEIAALTDFGRIPASAWLTGRRNAVGRVLREGVGPAMRSGQIDLLADVSCLVDEDLAHRQPLDLQGQDLTSQRFDLVEGLGQLDAASLAPPANQDLGFDDHGDPDSLGNSASLLGSRRHVPIRDGDAVLRENALGLILVKLQSSPPISKRLAH